MSEPYVDNQVEVTLLATFVDRPELLDDVTLDYTDFTDERCGLVYRTLRWMLERDIPITSGTLINKLATRLEPDFLATACNVTYSQPWAIKEHERIVRDQSTRRKILRAGQKLIDLSHNAVEMDADTLAAAEKAVSEIGAYQDVKGPRHIGDIMPAYWDDLEWRFKNKGKLTGVDTGFRQLNAFFGGWRATDFVVLAARPSMGKSAFMLQTANSGSKDDVVVVFSIEMGEFSLVDRLMSAEAYVPLYNIRNGRIEDSNWADLTQAASTIGERNLYVDENSFVTVEYVRSQLRKVARQVKDGRKIVAFVDYLQLVKSAVRGRSRTEEIGEVSKEMKAIAKELNCCIVALAQLSRGVENRQDKHPTLSDIRESGQIEQDADIIAFLYRDEYYNPETPKKNVVEVIIGKNRNGPIGNAEIAFLKEYQKFVDLEKEAK